MQSNSLVVGCPVKVVSLGPGHVHFVHADSVWESVAQIIIWHEVFGGEIISVVQELCDLDYINVICLICRICTKSTDYWGAATSVLRSLSGLQSFMVLPVTRKVQFKKSILLQ